MGPDAHITATDGEACSMAATMDGGYYGNKWRSDSKCSNAREEKSTGRKE